jgi:hypothetical protein
MASVSRRSFVALALCCGVLLASQALLVSVPMSASTAGSSCVELKRWAQSYRGTAPTLEQLARYDRAHRIAIFNAVSPQVQASLWQEQLRNFDKRNDLTVEQHQLIAEARNVVTPALYAHDVEATKASNALKPRVKAAFTSREHASYLSNIGFTGTPPQPQTATLWDKLTSPFVANAAPGVGCNCAPDTAWWDCGGGSCNNGGCSVGGGCGVWGGDTCTGRCG